MRVKWLVHLSVMRSVTVTEPELVTLQETPWVGRLVISPGIRKALQLVLVPATQ
jgi:hypothetical protein